MTRRAASASLTSSRSDKENAMGSNKKRVSQSFSDRPGSSSLLKRTLTKYDILRDKVCEGLKEF